MGSAFRKGSAQSGQSTGSSSKLDQLSAAILEQGGKIRDPIFGQLAEFVKGGNIPIGMTGAISTQEQELGTAKRGILESGVRGGQMRTALAQLPLERLGMRDQLRSSIYRMALDTAMGSANAGISGMGTAATNLNSLGQQRIQQNQALQQGIGQMAGMAGKAMMCWVAARFYGWEDPRTARIRAYWFYHRPTHWFTRWYRQHGEWASRQPWVWGLKPFFDMIGGR